VKKKKRKRIWNIKEKHVGQTSFRP
jgi:hypothetical protein